ncbi:ribose ABC transporter ribose-binding lipoprotein [Bacillus subtilis]|uniref:Ribose ABC transporter ribose-binding lipoprotein n=1 Tax=Bacillus subtilis TaxID=1423 RepID=A0A0D1J0Y5_BACIU|nr:ribose ABC transporter ribose-binding lipoprotein [Bacillus subtilis]
MKKAVSVISLSLFLLTACSLEPPQWAKPSNSGNKKEFTIGLSVSTLNNPFFVSLKKGIEKEAKKRGMKVIIVDAQNDSSKQTSDVEDLIQQGVDALLINPTDSSGDLNGSRICKRSRCARRNNRSICRTRKS